MFQDSPIFVYVHGGFWRKMNKNVSSYVVAPLYKNKIKTIIVGYSLCPKVKVIDIMHQIRKAILRIIKYADECQSK